MSDLVASSSYSNRFRNEARRQGAWPNPASPKPACISRISRPAPGHRTQDRNACDREKPPFHGVSVPSRREAGRAASPRIETWGETIIGQNSALQREGQRRRLKRMTTRFFPRMTMAELRQELTKKVGLAVVFNLRDVTLDEGGGLHFDVTVVESVLHTDQPAIVCEAPGCGVMFFPAKAGQMFHTANCRLRAFRANKRAEAQVVTPEQVAASAPDEFDVVDTGIAIIDELSS